MQAPPFNTYDNTKNTARMKYQNIPLESLKIRACDNTDRYSKSILENEIKDVHVDHVALNVQHADVDKAEDGYRIIYLFVKGTGTVIADDTSYEIVPETIFLPNAVREITIQSADSSLHYLRISCKLSKQDEIDLLELPTENTQNAYHAKFSDCQSYSEAIKSPNTISRTILSNEFIPRIAMGTVQTTGPDKVAAHEHPMLEQLFLGLSDNHCTVYADDSKVDFPPFSLLHIPLGSSHSVSVEKDKTLYYVWMDFFLDKKGEEWLQTHKVDSEP